MKDMKVLVVGSGGREYAVARALKKSPLVSEVYCAPGNSGLDQIGVKQLDIAEDDFKGLKDFAIKEEIDWTFVGPEDALVAGIVDYFHAFDLKIFGPNARAAQLEGSKDYALRFMEKYGVPHPRYDTFQDAESAIQALPEFGLPVVLKEDGLAGGKGVVIAEDQETAENTLREMFDKGQKQVVLEEFLTGPEYSVFAVMQGGEYRLLPLAQDHKRAYDDDKGPNTGGMGSYSPVPQLSQAEYDEIVDQLVKPTAAGLEKGGYDYHGVLYLGLMMTEKGPKMIEYNVRLGDPETEVVLPRLASDLAELVDANVNDREMPEVKETDDAVLGVILAAEGYPKSPLKGQKLGAFPAEAGIAVDYANVKADEAGDLFGNGGRILMVRATAKDLAAAQEHVYSYLKKLDIPQTFYRHDIGFRATGKKYLD